MNKLICAVITVLKIFTLLSACYAWYLAGRYYACVSVTEDRVRYMTANGRYKTWAY